MRELNKCGDVVISEEFVFGCKDKIEISCRFCNESFKMLEAFGDHLVNKHKCLMNSLSNYFSGSFNFEIGSETSFNLSDEERSELVNEEIEPPHVEVESSEVKLDNAEISFNFSIEGSEQEFQTIKETLDQNVDSSEAIFENAITEEVDLETGELDDAVATDDEQSADNDEDLDQHRRSHFTSFIMREEVFLEMIAQMESHPILWPIRYEPPKRKEWENAIDEIFNHLKTKFRTETFNKSFVKRNIATMKCRFGKAEIGEITPDTVPYYDRLTFLKGQTNKKPKEKLDIKCNSAGRYECPLCDKDFMRNENVLKHIRIHRGEYTCKCDICDKPFYFPNQLVIHMRLHTNEKPYICEICGKGFRLQGELTVHKKKIHGRQRDYKCTFCPKAYNKSEFLRDHLNAHKNLRPESCDTCGKRFFSKKLLRQHIKIHSEEKKYKCTLCGKAFAQPAGRASHMRSKHKTA